MVGTVWTNRHQELDQARLREIRQFELVIILLQYTKLQSSPGSGDVWTFRLIQSSFDILFWKHIKGLRVGTFFNRTGK